MKTNTRNIRTVCTFLFAAAALFTVVRARAFWTEPQALIRNSLQPSVRSVKSSNSIIKFAMEGGHVKIYVNGKKQKVLPGTKQIEVPLKKNDVVAFKCTKTNSPNKMAGLMATITYDGKTYRTGIDRFSTRGGFSKWPTWEKKHWDEVNVYENKQTGTSHDFCHWEDALKIENNWNKFDATASFVWGLTGKNTEVARTMFFRFVAGGETCSGKSLTTGKKDDKDDDGDDDDDDAKDKKKKGDDDDDDDAKDKKKKGDDDDDDDDKDKTKGNKKGDDDDDGDDKDKKGKGNKNDDDDDKDDDKQKGGKDDDDDDDDDKKPSGRVPRPKDDDDSEKDKTSLTGQSDSSIPDEFCACKLTVREGGECYDMEEPNASSGRCKPRPCEPKFECVASGETMCVKRRGGSKVVMVSPNNCVTEAAPNVEMLLPYGG